MKQLNNLFKEFNNIFGAKQNKMNKLIINGTEYELPTDNKNLSSVLNHFRLVREGKKDFIKLKNIATQEIELLHHELIEICEYEKVICSIENENFSEENYNKW